MSWRVPTDNEIKELEMHLGMSEEDADGTNWRGTDEGSKLAGEYDLWDSGDLRDDDAFGDSGFDVVPGGYRNTGGSFVGLGSYAYVWSSSPSSGNAWLRTLGSPHSTVFRIVYAQVLGFSVRCLRDTTGGESSDSDGTIYADAYEGNDGTKYDGVKIGDQVWITENLKETKYYDGSNIPRITDNDDWGDDTVGARCEYNNNASSEADTYGFLYNWHAVDNEKGLVNSEGGATGSLVKVYIEGTWVEKPMKTYLEGEWADKPVKVRVGDVWVDI